MLTNRRTIRIEWGDCDPAGIVFYPRYFAMFDHSTVLSIERGLGMTKHQLYATYEFHGYPVVDNQARLLIPTRYCDDVVIETAFAEVGRTSFRMQHRLLKDGALAVDASETRVWVVRDRAARAVQGAAAAGGHGRKIYRNYCAALIPRAVAMAASVLRWPSTEAANSAGPPGSTT
jgi:4-hydroxybenzoyl-CoA thioesterase